MEAQPDPLLSVLPLLIIQVCFAIVVFHIAKQKGLSPVKWTVLALVPLFGVYLSVYVFFATNLRHERMLQAIMEKLDIQKDLYEGR